MGVTLTVAKKWADADEADPQIKEDVGWAPRPDQQNHCPNDWCDDRRRNDHRDDRRNDNRDRRNDNRDRCRQDDFRGWQNRNRLSMPSSQRPSATTRMPTPRSFRVPTGSPGLRPYNGEL
jgi:hypothetical protein